MSNRSTRLGNSIKLAACAAVLVGCGCWALAGPPHYLIIHTSAFTGSSGLNDLVAAKTAQGFQVTTKELVAGATKEAIKGYIQGFWQTPDQPDYVLLIGDSDTIPYWTGTASRHATTDLYYVCMDAGDDWYPDIPIGRLAVRTTGQLTAAVNKASYVEAGSYADPTYITRVAFLGSDDVNAQAAACHDAVISAYITPAGLTPTRIYYPWPSGSGAGDITAAVNAGSLIVTYLGHSGSTSWWGPSFSQSDVNALTNTNKYGLVLGVCCDTANYSTTECFGETWLRKSQAGAAAYIGSTSLIFYTSSAEWESARRLEHYFFRAMFEDGQYRIGPALQAALYYFLADPDYGPTHQYTRNFFEEFTVLGDPALMLPLSGFQLTVDPPLEEVCTSPGSVQYTIHVDQHAGFTQAVTLAASGYPAGWNVSFSQNSLAPPFTSVMTVSNISGAAGLYDIALTGTSSGGLHRYEHALLHLASALPDAVVPSSPAAGASDVPRSPVFTWQAAARAAEYEVQIAPDYSFSTILYSATVDATSHNADIYLNPYTNYFWRVCGVNGCGLGAFSTASMFRTARLPNYLTEQFSGTIDIQHTTYTFVPDGSGDYYEVCGAQASALPTDPSGGTSVSLTEDGCQSISPTHPIWLYGLSYSYFYLNANGNLTFSGCDSTATETLASHFSRPRISPLFTDLSPQLGSVSYKNLTDRFVMTYQNVPEHGTTHLNTFQLELFYTTKAIRMTWLTCNAVGAVVGLSSGFGVPDGFVATDFTSYPCAAACCDEEGGCDVTDEATCVSPSFWHPEWLDCGVAECPLPAGACCFHDSHCEQLTQAACVAAAGTDWLAGALCAPNPCRMRGDLNCDGAVNVFDIDPFVLAIASAPEFTAYYAAYPDCDPTLGDANCDGSVNVFDIDPFVMCISGTCPDCP